LSSNPPAGQAPSDEVHVTIDGRPYAFRRGTLIVDAVHRAGRPIPYYCYHQKLAPAGACRVCMVQVEGAPVAPRGPIVTTACTTPVFEGLKIETMAPAARTAREEVIAFLLINHPLDCPICDKGGECDLQDFTLAYGPGVSRFAEQKILRRKADAIGPFLVLDQERCILCQRCVRYEREVLGEQNLVLKERGDRTVIDTGHTGEPYAGYFSGNNTELCPVGALTSRTYRFKARPWDVRSVATVCQGCSLGCNVTAQRRGERLVRILWRDNPEVDGGWLCDRGRYGFGHTEAPERLTAPLVRRGGRLEPADWDEALGLVAEGFRGGRVAVLGGGRLLDEEALLLAELARRVLGTPDLDWRVGAQAVASPGALGCPEARPADLDGADLVVLVDTNLEEEAPVLDLRLRRRATRGGAVLDLGPVQNFRWGPATRIACAPAELPEVVRSLEARVRGAARPVVVWAGRGGPALAEAVAALGAPLLVPGEFPNARGAEAAGLLPDLLPGYRSLADHHAVEEAWGGPVVAEAGRSAGEILAAAAQGALGALYLVGANPLRSFPDGDLARRALEAVPFLVVQDLFPTEAVERAHVVLPALGPLEKEGHATNLAGLVQPVARAHRGPVGALPDGEVFRRLAERLGRPLSGRAVPPAAVPARPRIPEPPASAAEEGTGLRRLVRPRLWAGGGTARFDPHLAEVHEEGVVRLAPEDAASLGLADGAAVELASDGVRWEATVRLDPRVARGWVLVPAHSAGNALGDAVAVRPRAEVTAR
jgi:NADH-quinone oxidoreductase subunit G